MYPWRTSKTAGAPPSLSKNIGLFKSENVAFGGTKLPSCHLHLEVLDLSSTFQGSKTIRSEMSEGEVTWSNCKTRSTGICLLDLLGSDGSDIWNIAKVLPRSTWNHDRGGCVRHVEATTCRFPSDQRVLMRPQWVLTILKLCRNNGHDWTWWYLNVLMIVTCCDNFFLQELCGCPFTLEVRDSDDSEATLTAGQWVQQLEWTDLDLLRCDRRPSTRQLELSAWHIVGRCWKSNK